MRTIIFSMGLFVTSALTASATEYTCTLSSEGQNPFVIEVNRIDLAKHTALMSVNGAPPERAETKLVGGTYSLSVVDNSGLLIIFHLLTIHALSENPSKAIYSVHAVADAAGTTAGAGKTTTGTCTSRF